LITKALLTPLFLLLRGIIVLMPSAFTMPLWAMNMLDLLFKALFFFPPDVWTTVMANVMFWLNVQFGWAVIEWVYKKIPGVD